MEKISKNKTDVGILKYLRLAPKSTLNANKNLMRLGSLKDREIIHII